MSVNAMRGAEQSRRDDLESLAYLFIYLMRGQLPWSNLMDVSLSERDEDMLRAKEKITPKQLCKVTSYTPNNMCMFLKNSVYI